jgi:hypothetical protein
MLRKGTGTGFIALRKARIQVAFEALHEGHI